MKNSPPSNKRAAYRVQARLRVFADLEGSKDLPVHCSRDISRSGMSLVSGQPIEVGQTIRLAFPDIDFSYHADATVVRCSNGNGDSGYDVGVRFATEKTELDERIYTEICQIETYRKTIEDVQGVEVDLEVAAKEWRYKFASTVR